MFFRHALSKYRLLWKLIKLADKAEQVQQDLQKIRQESFNMEFTYRFNHHVESDFAYRKGIQEGVDWCLNYTNG